MVVIGQIISLFGNAVLRFALPLYLLRETGSPALFGAVTACSFIPLIVFSLLGGVIADRKNKRSIMVTLDFTTAAVILLFYAALGKVPLVPLMTAALMILYGISGAYQPAVQSSIPLLTDKNLLMKGNAVINMVSTLSGLLGPVMGGILFGSFGIMPILFISAGCFVCSAVMEIFIHIPYQKNNVGKGIFKTVGSDLRECFNFIRNEKPIFLSVLGIIALINLTLSAALAVGIPVTVIQTLKMSDTALGITEAAMGLGGLTGGIAAGSAAQKLQLKNGWILLALCSAAPFIMGVSLINIVPPVTGYIMITIAGFAGMCAATLFNISILTAVQQQTPPLIMGKIMAAINAVSNCSLPLGQAVYGALFDTLAPYAVMFGAATASLIVAFCSKGVFSKLAAAL